MYEHCLHFYYMGMQGSHPELFDPIEIGRLEALYTPVAWG